MKPPTHVFLVGTSHAYQFGEGVTFGETTCTRETATQFRSYLEEQLRLNGIRAVAEEMSTAALEKVKRSVSLPKVLADDLALPHRYCDPSCRKQGELGIRDENLIRAIRQMDGTPPEEIEIEVLAERRKRESIWLAELHLLNVWPVLFICGAWHVPSFVALLEQSGHSTVTLAYDWVA